MTDRVLRRAKHRRSRRLNVNDGGAINGFDRMDRQARFTGMRQIASERFALAAVLGALLAGQATPDW
jgi:hypothetical protein